MERQSAVSLSQSKSPKQTLSRRRGLRSPHYRSAPLLSVICITQLLVESRGAFTSATAPQPRDTPTKTHDLPDVYWQSPRSILVLSSSCSKDARSVSNW
jgi:hypothetical protein